ncbi:MAG: hypothetical protein ACXWL2_02035 [Candidatus Chromulinivorax sp.]
MNYFLLIMSMFLLDYSVFGMNSEANIDHKDIDIELSVSQLEEKNDEPDLSKNDLKISRFKINKDKIKKGFCCVGCTSVVCVMPIMLGIFLPTTLHVRNNTNNTLTVGCTGAENRVKGGYPSRLRCSSLSNAYARSVSADNIKDSNPNDKMFKTCRHFSIEKEPCVGKDCKYTPLRSDPVYYQEKLVWKCIKNSTHNETLYQSFELEQKHRLRGYRKN